MKELDKRVMELEDPIVSVYKTALGDNEWYCLIQLPRRTVNATAKTPTLAIEKAIEKLEV